MRCYHIYVFDVLNERLHKYAQEYLLSAKHNLCLFDLKTNNKKYYEECAMPLKTVI